MGYTGGTSVGFCCVSRQSGFPAEVNKAVGNQDSNDMVVDSTATRIITNRDRGGIRWLEVSTDIIMNRHCLGWDQLPQSSVPRIPR